ncbi:MAG: ATP-grasp domain-containing protein [Gammaproteobacteria bacterium]
MALSARALAQSARRGGVRVHAVDLFADLDTRACAESACAVAAVEGGFNRVALLDALQARDSDQRMGLVVGSGFEGYPELLETLISQRRFYGNPPEVVQKVKDPKLFVPLLERLGLPYPAVIADGSGETAPLLVKGNGGCGGTHVSWYARGAALPKGHYLQRYVSGRSLSALFLANGDGAEIIGFSQTWCAGFNATPFRYGGAVSLSEPPAPVRRELSRAVASLTKAAGLKGLCGIDVIVDREARVWVLEVNPRPPATFELHEQEGSLFMQHVRSCIGGSPAAMPQEPRRGARAAAVYYAEQPTWVPASWHWPSWSADRTPPATWIGRGAPICTVFGQAASSWSAKRLALVRARRVSSALGSRAVATPDQDGVQTGAKNNEDDNDEREIC